MSEAGMLQPATAPSVVPEAGARPLWFDFALPADRIIMDVPSRRRP